MAKFRFRPDRRIDGTQMPLVKAIARYRGIPGVYLLTTGDGRQYVGRQGPGGNRLAAHLRAHPRRYISAALVPEYDDCRRAAFEAEFYDELRENGVLLINQVRPDSPTRCHRRRSQRR